MRKRKKSYQITVRKIGRKYVVCISGNPKKIYDTLDKAQVVADNLRLKIGRRPKRKK